MGETTPGCGSYSRSLRLQLNHHLRSPTLAAATNCASRHRQRSPASKSGLSSYLAQSSAKTESFRASKTPSTHAPTTDHHYVSSYRTPNPAQQSPQNRSSATRSLPPGERAAHFPVPVPSPSRRKPSRNRDSHHITLPRPPHGSIRVFRDDSTGLVVGNPTPRAGDGRQSRPRRVYLPSKEQIRDSKPETAGCCTRRAGQDRRQRACCLERGMDIDKQATSSGPTARYWHGHGTVGDGIEAHTRYLNWAFIAFCKVSCLNGWMHLPTKKRRNSGHDRQPRLALLLGSHNTTACLVDAGSHLSPNLDVRMYLLCMYHIKTVVEFD